MLEIVLTSLTFPKSHSSVMEEPLIPAGLSGGTQLLHFNSPQTALHFFCAKPTSPPCSRKWQFLRPRLFQAGLCRRVGGPQGVRCTGFKQAGRSDAATIILSLESGGNLFSMAGSCSYQSSWLRAQKSREKS